MKESDQVDNPVTLHP